MALAPTENLTVEIYFHGGDVLRIDLGNVEIPSEQIQMNWGDGMQFLPPFIRLADKDGVNHIVERAAIRNVKIVSTPIQVTAGSPDCTLFAACQRVMN
jgi:hypothetical protein